MDTLTVRILADPFSSYLTARDFPELKQDANNAKTQLFDKLVNKWEHM